MKQSEIKELLPDILLTESDLEELLSYKDASLHYIAKRLPTLKRKSDPMPWIRMVAESWYEHQKSIAPAQVSNSDREERSIVSEYYRSVLIEEALEWKKDALQKTVAISNPFRARMADENKPLELNPKIVAGLRFHEYIMHKDGEKTCRNSFFNIKTRRYNDCIFASLVEDPEWVSFTKDEYEKHFSK